MQVFSVADKKLPNDLRAGRPPLYTMGLHLHTWIANILRGSSEEKGVSVVSIFNSANPSFTVHTHEHGDLKAKV